jgi:hypothetical protein
LFGTVLAAQSTSSKDEVLSLAHQFILADDQVFEFLNKHLLLFLPTTSGNNQIDTELAILNNIHDLAVRIQQFEVFIAEFDEFEARSRRGLSGHVTVPFSGDDACLGYASIFEIRKHFCFLALSVGFLSTDDFIVSQNCRCGNIKFDYFSFIQKEKADRFDQLYVGAYFSISDWLLLELYLFVSALSLLGFAVDTRFALALQ